MSHVCTHGASDNWWWKSLPGGVWAGGLAICECCKSEFGYIDMAQVTSNGKSASKTWTKDRCERCGGHYIDYGFEPATKK
jgi:hypothetical protein